MEKTFIDKVGTILSFLGAIISILNLLFPDMNLLMNNIIIILIILFFLTLAMFYFRAFKIKDRYVKGVDELKKLHQEIILLQNQIKDVNENNFSQPLHQICHKISKIFTKLRGEQICACIKYINATNNGEYYVQSLCRDADSIERDKLLRPINTDKDYIHNNSDFSLIINDIAENVAREKIFFFSNNLPKEYGYLNSHLNEKKIRNLFLRSKHWPLPYKSTIIVPVISVTKQPKDSALYAFFCIDCTKTKAFEKTTDIAILQAISLQLFPVIEYVCNKYLIKNERRK